MDPSLPERSLILNGSRRILEGLLFWAVALGSGPGLAQGSTLQQPESVAVRVSWQTLPKSVTSLDLEVASDPGFASVVATGPARGSGLEVNLPGEGVYHWRLVRSGVGEASSPQSGSFVALGPAREGDDPARLSWPEVEGVQRFIVLVRGPKTQRLNTTGLSMVVTRAKTPLLVEVFPQAQGKAGEGPRFNPDLRLAGGRALPLPEEPAAPAIASGGFSPDESPTQEASTSTSVTAEPAAPPATTVPSQTEVSGGDAAPKEAEVPAEADVLPLAGRKVHHVFIGAQLWLEEFRTSKLESSLNADGSGVGGVAGFWSNPTGGLVLQAQAQYHELEQDLEIQTQTGGEKIPFDRARYDLDFSIGFDLFQSWPGRSQALILSAAATLTQLPLLGVVWDGRLGESPPPMASEQLDFVGGGIAWAKNFSAGRIGAEYSYLLVPTREKLVREADQSRVALSAEWWPGDGIWLMAGVQQRQTVVIRCAKDAGTCLEEGKVRSALRNRAILLGIGAVRL
jgi:hypothetical protein